MQRMRRVTKRQTKDIEKESISILFDATLCINFFFFFFHSLVRTCKVSCKHLIMGCVPCSDEFFIKCLISKKERKEKKERKVLFTLLVRFTF